jgi:hypothetical protein
MNNSEALAARQFRKKPVVIEAWRIDINAERPDWVEAALAAETLDWDLSGDGMYINTLEGCMHGPTGHWMIRGVKGELYACEPSIFAATYEPALAAAQPAAREPAQAVPEDTVSNRRVIEKDPGSAIGIMQMQQRTIERLKAEVAALTRQPSAAPAQISDERIDALADSYMGVSMGSYDITGHREFARALLAEAAPAPAAEPTPASMVHDMLAFGTVWTRVDADGNRTRVDPRDVRLPEPAAVSEEREALAEKIRDAYRSKTRFAHPMWRNLDDDRKEPWRAAADAARSLRAPQAAASEDEIRRSWLRTEVAYGPAFLNGWRAAEEHHGIGTTQEADHHG